MFSKKLKRFISTCCTSVPEINDRGGCFTPRVDTFSLFSFQSFPLQRSSVHDLLTVLFSVVFPHQFKLETLPCTFRCTNTSINRKKPQADMPPKIQPQQFNVAPRQEPLCLKQPLFVCYFSMWLSPALHYYLCTSNTPCFRGQTWFAQTVCHHHQRPRRNSAGGCRGFGVVSWSPR